MATTAGIVRNRYVTLIKGITPTVHEQQKFRPYREQKPPFREWCDKNPSACLRMFQVRGPGDTSQSLVTDHRVERVEQSILITVAYPADFRHGETGLDLDDAIAFDEVRIEATVGVPSSDATLKSLASIFRVTENGREDSDSGAVVFLTIPYRIEFARSLA